MKTSQFSYCMNLGWKNLAHAAELDSKNTLILAFCSPEFRTTEGQGLLKNLDCFFPQSSIVGCSTAGEILGRQINDKSISLTAIKFDSSFFKVIELPIDDVKQSGAIGSEIGYKLNSFSDNLKGIFIFTDGLKTNGSELTAGINSMVSASTVVSGGLAADGPNFVNTWVLRQGKILSNTVVAVGIYGGEELFISSASRGGWDKFGPERIITSSSGNVVYEIDEKPALDLYRTYLGERAGELPSAGLFFPLQIRSSMADENRLVRTLLSVDENKKSITFAGDMPQGYVAQLMKANFERVIEAASDAGSEIKKAYENYNIECGSSFALAVSCVGRRLVLGERAEEELEALAMSLPVDTPVAGFYSYGEIGVNIVGGACDLHNQSMTVLTLVEQNKKSAEKVS